MIAFYRGEQVKRHLLIAIVLSIVLAGCEAILGGDCTDILLPSIRLDVRDARTGEPVARGATAWIEEGTFVDTLREGYPGKFAGPLSGERPGTYSVFVRMPGYELWSRHGVRVREGRCHVRTVDLVASLPPLP